MVAHNGEINTVKGNFNWMRAREGVMKSPVLGDDLTKLYPISFEGQSDTATFDNALELLTMAGYPLAHAAMMMIPEAWEQHELMDERRRAFYEYHAADDRALGRPGRHGLHRRQADRRHAGPQRPAARALHRHRRRPRGHGLESRACCRSPRAASCKKWRLQPGKMFLIDLEQGRIVDDEELKNQFASAKPVPPVDRERAHPPRRHRCRRRRRRPAFGEPLLDRQQAFGYTQEDLKFLLAPDGRRRRGGHRLDGQRLAAGRAVGQEQAAVQLLQAAVRAGDEPADRPDPRGHRDVAEQLHRPQAEPAGHQRGEPADAPGGDAAGARLRGHGAAARDRAATPAASSAATSSTSPTRWPGAREGVEAKLASLCAEAVDAIRGGHNILIITDRAHGAARRSPSRRCWRCRPIHHHLVREGLRTTAGLVVETGSAREVHHFAVLAGYGAEAVHPYLAHGDPGRRCTRACRAS
jgi:hypothetical protein